MPKRSLEEKIARYSNKIQKLKQKAFVESRVIQSSESDADNNDVDTIIPSDIPIPTEPHTPAPTEETSNANITATADTPKEPELEPDILVALGEALDDTPEFGENIHENLAQRWQPILRKGISKESKDNLFIEYRVPANCSLLQAPKLNAELLAAISDMTRNRDKKMEAAQQQLGVGITALNRAMTLLLLITGGDKIQAIKLLSDSCRILTDLHFIETQARIKMLTPGLDKSFINVIKESERDSTLFGLQLSEKIKASKAVEKQGLQIKKTNPTHKPPTVAVQSTVSRPRYQENWAGPSRFQSNRGGRGGQKRQFPAIRKTVAGPQNKSNPSRPRQPPHQ